MRRILARRILIAGLAVAVALASRPVWTAEKAPNDRLLPQNTYLYVTVPNVGELKTRFGESHIGRLLKDPKLQDFMGDLHKKFAQFGEEFEKNVGLKLTDVLAIPDGEVSLAVVLPTDAKKLAVAVILDFGKSSGSTVNTLLDKASTELTKNGFKKTTRTVEGSEMVVYTKAKDKDKEKDKDEKKEGSDSDEPDFGSQFAQVVKNDTLILTTSPVAVQDILKRWDGKHADTLADVPAYKSIVESSHHGHTPPVLLGYLNPIALVQAFVRSNDQAAESLGMAMAFLPVLGLDNLKAIGGSVQMGTEEYDSEFRLQVYLDKEASGVLKVLTFPPTKQSPPKWVTEDTSSYIGINWDVPKAYTAVEALADQIMGPGATSQKLDEWAAADSLNIHLKKDVIDNLDGVIHIASDNPDPNKPQTSRILVAIGVKNAKKMKAVLDKLAKMPNFQAEARDFKGEVIYNLAAPGLAQFGNSNQTMGVAVVNDLLMFSTDVSRIEQVILGDKERKPLAESERYKALAKHFPAQTSLIWYQEPDKQLKPLYEMLRSGKVQETIASTPLAKIFEGIDFKKLPEFDAIRKYLPPTASYAIPEGNGAVFVSFSLKGAIKE
jgi:hypothetical protein